MSVASNRTAGVDYVVDEDGNPIGIKPAKAARPTPTEEGAIASTSPTAWWRYGLVALLIVAAILLGMQLLSGNKGTDVIPGTPVAAPQNNVPVPGAL